MRLTLLIRRSILEPYARRRRRRIAIAQLKALDDRLLADIGVRRNDIERTVSSRVVTTPCRHRPPCLCRPRTAGTIGDWLHSRHLCHISSLTSRVHPGPENSAASCRSGS
jgi:uncharacterized protein YjiS (DUF1127 family)